MYFLQRFLLMQFCLSVHLSVVNATYFHVMGLYWPLVFQSIANVWSPFEGELWYCGQVVKRGQERCSCCLIFVSFNFKVGLKQFKKINAINTIWMWRNHKRICSSREASCSQTAIRKDTELKPHEICNDSHFCSAGNEEPAKCHSCSITSDGPLKCLLLGLHPLWEEGQWSRELLSIVVLVLCICLWLPLPSHLESDPLLVRDGNLRSSKDSGSDPSVTSLDLAGLVWMSAFIQY